MRERVKLTVEELDAMMPPGDEVHCYANPVSAVLIGCDWRRATILQLAKDHGAVLSGEMATAMKHGAAVKRPEPEGPLFVETVSKPETRLPPTQTEQ